MLNRQISSQTDNKDLVSVQGIIKTNHLNIYLMPPIKTGLTCSTAGGCCKPPKTYHSTLYPRILDSTFSPQFPSYTCDGTLAGKGYFLLTWQSILKRIIQGYDYTTNPAQACWRVSRQSHCSTLSSEGKEGPSSPVPCTHTRGFTPVMSSLKSPIYLSLKDWLEETCQGLGMRQDLASGWKPWALKG